MHACMGFLWLTILAKIGCFDGRKKSFNMFRIQHEDNTGELDELM